MVFWQVGQPPCTAAWPYMANVQSCAFLSWRWVNWRSNCSQRLTCCRRQWLRIAERLATLLPCHSTICIYISSVIPSCWWVVLGWSIVHGPPTAIPTTIHGTRRESFLRALCMAVSWQRAAGRNALNRSAQLWKWQVRPCSVWMAIGSTPCKRLNLGSSRASHAFMWREVDTPSWSSTTSKSSTTTAAWPWGCTLSWDLWLRPLLLPTSSAWRRTRNQPPAWYWRMSRRGRVRADFFFLHKAESTSVVILCFPFYSLIDILLIYDLACLSVVGVSHLARDGWIGHLPATIHFWAITGTWTRFR